MIKIGTININGLLDTTKQNALFQYCRDHKLMITFIQETHISTEEQMRHLNSNYGGKTFWSFGTSFSRGVGIIFDTRLQFQLLNFKHDYKGRLLVVNIQIETVKYSLVTVLITLPNVRPSF
jgi:exonuclease III